METNIFLFCLNLENKEANTELRNHNFKGFSNGGTKGLWVSNSNSKDEKLVICESPLDCLSYHQLFPDDHTRYFATSGTLSEKQKDLLRTAFENINQKGGEIIIATDRDIGGNEIAQKLKEIAPNSAQISRHVQSIKKIGMKLYKLKFD